ncbi:MAG: hypothetical protein ACR2NO_02810 [Chloroflexota bacterium]
MNAKESAKLAESDAKTAIHAAEIAVRAATPKPPDPRQAPFFDLLASAERTAFARILPRRNRWPELKALDDRFVELDQQQAAATAELSELRVRQQQAEQAHPAAVAVWLAGGRRDARPESAASGIGRRIELLEADVAAYTTLLELAAREKAEFVRKHRKRLVSDARAARETAGARYLSLVGGLAEAREELRATAETVTWAALFPDASLAGEPNTVPLAAGHVKTLREAVPGLTMALTLANVVRLLEADARVLADARTREQQAALQGLDPRTLAASGAVWEQTAEGKAKDRAEKREAIERYRQEWGHDPE